MDKARLTVEEEKEHKLLQKHERKQELEDMRWLLSSPQGVRIFRRLIEMSKIFDGSIMAGASLEFREGRRNLGLQFYSDAFEAAPLLARDAVYPVEKSQ